jgi:phosphohistidine phosphatase
MKILTLIRHAKSSWDDKSLADKQRPLNKRGLRDAPVMGKRLAKHGAKPDLILSSPATRALSTAEIIAEQIGYSSKAIAVDDRLYASSADALLMVIHELDSALERVMMFGHNPGLTDLAHRLTSGKIDDIPTCGVVQLAFDVDTWRDIGTVKPAQVELDAPKARS